jgi:transposase
LRNGLIRCCKCKTLWNRDLNGALNIYHVAGSNIQGQARPANLTNGLASELVPPTLVLQNPML